MRVFLRQDLKYCFKKKSCSTDVFKSSFKTRNNSSFVKIMSSLQLYENDAMKYFMINGTTADYFSEL